MIDVRRDIEELVAFAGRGPGTDAERRAALHLRDRLAELGRDAEREPIHVHPRWAATHALHALLVVVGSVLAVDVPVAGAALLLAVAVSAFGDLTGSFLLLRRLTGRRASQNVLSREDGGKPGTIVLVAHYDAGRGGAVLSPRAQRRRARAGRLLLRRPLGLFEPFFWSIVVVLACAIARLFEVEALWLTIVQFVPTVVLIVYVPLLADVALSPFARGADDNASGVATVLALADRYGGALEHFDVWVLLTGAGDGLMAGMRAFLRRHRRELDPTRTVFIEVRAVGSGTVAWARKEGAVVAARYHPTVLALCAEIEGGEPAVVREAGDAHLARLRGYPAVSVRCVRDDGVLAGEEADPEALARAEDFCGELIERIDEQVGPELT